MTDPFSWSISLGRWAGTQVRVHLLLLLFVLSALLRAALTPGGSLGETAGWLLLLLVVLVLHELGHAAMATRLGVEIDEVRFWPLGNLAGPSPTFASRSSEAFLIAVAGPLTSLVLALIAAIGLSTLADAHMVWNPFGNNGTGAPTLKGGQVATAFSGIWWAGWFGYLTWVVGLANLIPALPMDFGRALRAFLASPAVDKPRDSLIAPYTARVCAAVLLLAGLVRLLFAEHREGAWTLIGLAFLFEWMVRIELRLLEDGGFYDEGIFGYDFSEGYTSLEGSVPKVRPYRESALRRWRRRRSDLRRQRRLAREAAEEQRMDEILAKISSQGRAALTDEEVLFLVRVSAKYRSKPKARD